MASGVARRCGPLQNRTVSVSGLISSSRAAISLCGDRSRARQRSSLEVRGQPRVDQRQAGGDVLDHLHLADRAHARRELDRGDGAPGRVDDQPPRLAVDGTARTLHRSPCLRLRSVRTSCRRSRDEAGPHMLVPTRTLAPGLTVRGRIETPSGIGPPLSGFGRSAIRSGQDSGSQRPDRAPGHRGRAREAGFRTSIDARIRTYSARRAGRSRRGFRGARSGGRRQAPAPSSGASTGAGGRRRRARAARFGGTATAARVSMSATMSASSASTSGNNSAHETRPQSRRSR